MSSKGAGEFTKASFLDYDQRRTTFGSRPIGTGAGEQPVPEVERVLKISIPYEPVWTEDATGSLRLNLNSTKEEIDIDPCGYVKLEYLDDYLRDRLCTLQSISINGPQITGSGRQLIDIDAPLYATLFDEAERPEGLSVPRPDWDSLDQMTNLLDAHERDPDTRGSHAHTLLNPKTRSMSVNMAMLQMMGHISNSLGDNLPVRSVVYNELYAIAAERRNHPQSTERWALDMYRQTTSDPTYSIALEILTWLRDEHRLSYTEITTLLDMCRYDPIPMHTLCGVLLDLTNGMAVEDIPYHSHVFGKTTPDDYYSRIDKFFDKINPNLHKRIFFTTFETISLAEGKVIKEWWTRDPPAIFPLPIIRLLIHLRDMASWSEQEYNQPLIPTTRPRQSLTEADRNNVIYDGEVIAGLKYQDPRISISQHPLRTAMEDSASLDKLNKIVGYGNEMTKIQSYWNSVGKEVIHEIYEFKSLEEFYDWVTGAAPTDSKIRQLTEWFL